MDLGVRHIRTAGKGSGSVELTLPATFRRLVGLPCRILLHDGEQPDIVLQPELSAARAVFGVVWRSLAVVLIGAPAPDFDACSFSFGLLPQQGPAEAGYLCWQDGLALAAGSVATSAAGRVVATCGEKLAADVGVSDELASSFGAVCGFLTCGQVAFPAWREPCDIASAELGRNPGWRPGAAYLAYPDICSSDFWAALSPALAAASELFATFSLPGSAYPALHAAWRRGRSIELNRG
jgi:hypothetical protein